MLKYFLYFNNRMAFYFNIFRTIAVFKSQKVSRPLHSTLQCSTGTDFVAHLITSGHNLTPPLPDPNHTDLKFIEIF